MIYKYVDELDNLTHEINHKLDELMEKIEKRIKILHRIMMLLYSFEIVGGSSSHDILESKTPEPQVILDYHYFYHHTSVMTSSNE